VAVVAVAVAGVAAAAAVAEPRVVEGSSCRPRCCHLLRNLP